VCYDSEHEAVFARGHFALRCLLIGHHRCRSRLFLLVIGICHPVRRWHSLEAALSAAGVAQLHRRAAADGSGFGYYLARSDVIFASLCPCNAVGIRAMATLLV
jgi:hypothetical protein